MMTTTTTDYIIHYNPAGSISSDAWWRATWQSSPLRHKISECQGHVLKLLESGTSVRFFRPKFIGFSLFSGVLRNYVSETLANLVFAWPRSRTIRSEAGDVNNAHYQIARSTKITDCVYTKNQYLNEAALTFIFIFLDKYSSFSFKQLKYSIFFYNLCKRDITRWLEDMNFTFVWQ